MPHVQELSKPKCPECDQELKARQYLVNHFKKVHGRLPPGYENQQKFMCDQCTNVFFNEWSLKLHIKSKHSNDSRIHCTSCVEKCW